MTRTNTKEFMNIVTTYIIDAISWDGYDIDLSEATDKEKLQFVADRFDNQYNYPQNKIIFPNIQDRLADWLKGLPSVINIDFENYRILELAREWGTLEEHANERQEDKIIANWFNFISFKILQVMRKHDIYLQ